MHKHKELDKILDDVEEAFLSLIIERKIRRATIERWRWDEPVITLSWVGADDISRNAHALVEGNSPAYSLKIEVNAWRDKDRQEGDERVRHWQHKEIDLVSVSDDMILLRQALGKGYSIVANWTEQDLQRQAKSIQWAPSS